MAGITAIEESGQSLTAGQWAKKFLCGGLGGCFVWFVIYPLDIINTNIQTTNEKSMGRSFVQLYREDGIRRFYRGLGPTMLRSLYADAITLVAFDWMNQNFVTKYYK